MSSLNADLATAICYTRRGLRVLRASPWQYIQILSVFAAPAAVAAYVTASDMPEGFGRSALLYVLNAISASAAPVVVMTAVAAGFHGVTLGFMAAMRQGLWWLLRYLWTNAHTSVIFWVPTLVLLNLFEWQRRDAPVDGWAGVAVTAAWVVLIGLVALYVHSRTLLAPFFAVHGNLPATLATIESWRMSGRRFPLVFSTFVVSAAPTAVPLAVVSSQPWHSRWTNPTGRGRSTWPCCPRSCGWPSRSCGPSSSRRPTACTQTYGRRNSGGGLSTGFLRCRCSRGRCLRSRAGSRVWWGWRFGGASSGPCESEGAFVQKSL